MAGSLRNRGGGSWQLVVYRGYDTKAHMRRYATRTFRGTKREAERALAAFVTGATVGRELPLESTSVAQVLARWLEYRSAHLAPSTADRYRVAMSFVFSSEPDGAHPYHPHTITRTFVAACSAAGVPRMRLRDLRHHSATTLLKQGATVGEVMDRHGWKTVEMVNRYRHSMEAKDLASAIVLEEA